MFLLFCASLTGSCLPMTDGPHGRALVRPLAAASARCVALQAEVLTEINRLRADPQGYVATLRRYGQFFRANLVVEPGQPDTLTDEGVEPVNEAARELARQSPLGPLTVSDALALAANDHCREQGDDGALGHDGRDGSTPGDRVARRGGGPYVGEVITYGSTDAADVVRQLIVDDGVPDRGHRALLLAPDLHFAGVACGPHPGYRQVCVIDLARTADGRSEVEVAQGGGTLVAMAR